MEDLPAYVYSDCCEERHFLVINKDVQGKWSASYMDIETGEAVDGLWLNEAPNLEQVAKVLKNKLKRWQEEQTENA